MDVASFELGTEVTPSLIPGSALGLFAAHHGAIEHEYKYEYEKTTNR